MGKVLVLVVTAIFAFAASALSPAAAMRPAGTSDLPQPPVADPEALATAYYSTLTAAINSGDFTALVAFFTDDASISADISAGGANGPAEILALFRKLPAMTGFTVETSNVIASDPYVDVDWRYRAAQGSMRGYLDGHDTFKVRDGLIYALSQQVDKQAADEAFMPPPIGAAPKGTPVAKDKVRIANFKYMAQVVKIPVGGTVTWTNDDSDSHTVTTEDRTIDSGVIEQQVSTSLTFAVAGEYPYYCTIHPGMRGKVVVGGP